MVLISNKPKTDDFPDHLVHFIDLSTPRPIVYTEDYDKIVQPHAMALNYVYYDIYTQMIEMTRDFRIIKVTIVISYLVTNIILKLYEKPVLSMFNNESTGFISKFIYFVDILTKLQ